MDGKLRVNLFFLIIFFILTTTSLQAGQQGIEVNLAGLESIRTEPRQVVTITFRVTNTSEEEREFIGSVTLPEGWQLITQEFPFELSPNESDVRLVSFFIPQGVLAGSYEITYTVRDQKTPSISDWHSITVEVLPVAELEVKLLEAPEYVIAGEEYSSHFIIINQSNITTTLRLEIKSENGYPTTADLTKFQLKPGESKTITVAVKTNAKIQKKLIHCLQLRVKTLDLEGEQLQQTAISSVEIIPRITGIEDRFYRLPVKIRLRGEMKNGGESRYGFQPEISGLGTLDEERTRHIDFLLRAPGIQDKPIFSEQGKYYLSYTTVKYEIYLGDGHYSLSPLTEFSHYGRGIEATLNSNNFTIRAYHEESPYVESRREDTAAHLGYRLKESYDISINYLRKKKEFVDEGILSLRGLFKPSENIEFDMEYGWGKNDKAYRLKALGHHNWISYCLETIHAGPDYPGYYSDMDSMSANIAIPLQKNLRLNASYREEEKNLERNPSLYPAPLKKLYQLGLAYKFKGNANLSFDYRNYEREDLLPQPDFNYQEETYKIDLRHSFEKLSLSTSFEQGKKQDRLTGQTSDLTKYNISTYFKPSKKQSYRSYLQFYDDGSITGEHRHRITGGINASFQVQKRTSFNLNFQRSEHQEFPSENRDNFEIRLSHLLVNNSKISMYGRLTSFKSLDHKDETSFVLEYIVPFGLSVSLKKSIGILKGHLYDAESGEGIADAIIRVGGLTSVTNSQGNFTFPSLKPGMYYLKVDKAEVGLDKITIQKTPLEVNVEGGKETRIEIGVTRGAKLSGQIMVYRFPGGSSFIEEKRDNVIRDGQSGNGEEELVESYGLANILVELTNDLEIKRCITDKKGNFRFEELRPGKWTLKVYEDNLPEYYYFERNRFKFELKPGQGKEILVKVLPKKRFIHIIEEGGILLEE